MGLAALVLMAGFVLALDWAVESDRRELQAAVDADDALLGFLPTPIRESSGVAVSRRHGGVLWTHNDQAGEPILFAVRQEGDLVGTYRVPGAQALDWEDVSFGPCPVAEPGGRSDASDASGGCLYVADIGDNQKRRSSVALMIVREPDPRDGASNGVAELLAQVQVAYPDGPADAEAAAVSESGDVLIATKGDDGPVRLYRVPASAFRARTNGGGQAVLAERVATLGLPGGDLRITGASMQPGGGVLALRSHDEVFLFRVGEWEAPIRVCPVPRDQPQGEAIAHLDESTFVLTTEAPSGLASILRMECAAPEGSGGGAE